MRLRRCVRREGKETGKRVYIVSLVAWSTRVWSRIGFKYRSWQNLAGFGRLGGIWQNAADCRQIAVDCRQIAIKLSFRGRSLLAASVETGGNRWTCIRCHGGVP